MTERSVFRKRSIMCYKTDETLFKFIQLGLPSELGDY